MRRRSLAVQILGGALVAALVVAAVVVGYVAIVEGTAAVRSGRAGMAAERGLVALLAAVVAVVAPALYSHWLFVTYRPRPAHEQQHVPSPAQLVLVGLLVAVVVVAGWPVLSYLYDEAREAFLGWDLAWGIGYAVAGLGYLWFAGLAVKRYVQWALSRRRTLERIRSGR